MAAEAATWGVSLGHSGDGDFPELRSQDWLWSPPHQACLCASVCPWAVGMVVAAVPVAVAAAGGSRETVTPRCFVNCFSQLVCSGLGLERHRMEV